MAVKFFRMSDAGSITRPNLAAIVTMMIGWSTSLIVLINQPFIFVGVAVPIVYVVSAVVMANPLRLTLGKAMHLSREAIVLAVPTRADRLWLAANLPTFERTGIKLYLGEPIESESVGAADAVEANR